MEKLKRKNSEGKVYKVQSKMLWIIALGVVFIVFRFSYLSTKWQEAQMSMWCLVCIALPIGYWLFTIFANAQTRITFYEDGLEYRQGGKSLFTKWDDMSHLGRHKKDYGIYLHRKIEPKVNGVIDKIFFGAPTNFIDFSSVVNVPIHNDKRLGEKLIELDKFAQTEFGSDLKHYAPHLFEKGKI